MASTFNSSGMGKSPSGSGYRYGDYNRAKNYADQIARYTGVGPDMMRQNAYNLTHQNQGYSAQEATADPYAEYKAGWDDWWAQLKSSLQAWRKNAKANNLRGFEDSRDQANRTMMLRDKLMKETIGGDLTASGRSMRNYNAIRSGHTRSIADARNTMNDANARVDEEYGSRYANAYEKYLNAIRGL